MTQKSVSIRANVSIRDVTIRAYALYQTIPYRTSYTVSHHFWRPTSHQFFIFYANMGKKKRFLWPAEKLIFLSPSWNNSQNHWKLNKIREGKGNDNKKEIWLLICQKRENGIPVRKQAAGELGGGRSRDLSNPNK